MNEGRPHRSIRFMAELGLRVNDLPRMISFYRDVIGLDVFHETHGFCFLRVAEGVEGHPQLLVLFDRDVEVGQATTTLDHFAFLIDLDDYEDEARRLEAAGVTFTRKEFPDFGWRSLFFLDPESNTVEFVAHDPDVGEPPSRT